MADIMTMSPDLYIYVLIVLLGLAIGSFLNVLVYRLPREKTTILARSACPHCGHMIPMYLNIPLVSFVILLGRCRYCRGRISWRYPLVEFLNAGLYLFFFYLDGPTPQMVVHSLLSSALIVIFFIDLEFQIIPDQITLPGIVLGLLAGLFMKPPGIIGALIGLAVGGGTLLGIAYLGEWLFKKEAMGGGDVKMAAMMGAFVGWQKVLLIFMGGAVIGMIVSIVWMAVSERVRKERLIPFGPFLAIASIAVLAYGDEIVRYYIIHFLR